MKITRSEHKGKRFYQLVLSRRDFDDLCSGCPDSGFIVGKHADVYFHIFEGSNISNSWVSMSEGYGITVGAKAPVPPPNATPEEWDESAQRFYDSLEDAINNSGIRPIENELDQSKERRIYNLGYVVMTVE